MQSVTVTRSRCLEMDKVGSKKLRSELRLCCCVMFGMDCRRKGRLSEMGDVFLCFMLHILSGMTVQPGSVG